MRALPPVCAFSKPCMTEATSLPVVGCHGLPIERAVSGLADYRVPDRGALARDSLFPLPSVRLLWTSVLRCFSWRGSLPMALLLVVKTRDVVSTSRTSASGSAARMPRKSLPRNGVPRLALQRLFAGARTLTAGLLRAGLALFIRALRALAGFLTGASPAQRRQRNPGAARFAQSDGYSLLRRASPVLSVPHVFDFLMYEFAGGCGGRFPFSQVFLGFPNGGFIWHSTSLPYCPLDVRAAPFVSAEERCSQIKQGFGTTDSAIAAC